MQVIVFVFIGRSGPPSPPALLWKVDSFSSRNHEIIEVLIVFLMFLWVSCKCLNLQHAKQMWAYVRADGFPQWFRLVRQMWCCCSNACMRSLEWFAAKPSFFRVFCCFLWRFWKPWSHQLASRWGVGTWSACASKKQLAWDSTATYRNTGRLIPGTHMLLLLTFLSKFGYTLEPVDLEGN